MQDRIESACRIGVKLSYLISYLGLYTYVIQEFLYEQHAFNRLLPAVTCLKTRIFLMFSKSGSIRHHNKYYILS